MADHYRGLIKSLMKLGFLFKRQGERKHEIWRNRLTDQHVMFDRDDGVQVARGGRRRPQGSERAGGKARDRAGGSVEPFRRQERQRSGRAFAGEAARPGGRVGTREVRARSPKASRPDQAERPTVEGQVEAQAKSRSKSRLGALIGERD